MSSRGSYCGFRDLLQLYKKEQRISERHFSSQVYLHNDNKYFFFLWGTK